jgi:hypothetical protein
MLEDVFLYRSLLFACRVYNTHLNYQKFRIFFEIWWNWKPRHCEKATNPARVPESRRCPYGSCRFAGGAHGQPPLRPRSGLPLFPSGPPPSRPSPYPHDRLPWPPTTGGPTLARAPSLRHPQCLSCPSILPLSLNFLVPAYLAFHPMLKVDALIMYYDCLMLILASTLFESTAEVCTGYPCTVLLGMHVKR